MWPDMLFMEFSIHALTLNIDDNSSTNTEGVYDILIWFVSTSNVWASLLASLLATHENIWLMFSCVWPTTKKDILICQKVKRDLVC